VARARACTCAYRTEATSGESESIGLSLKTARPHESRVGPPEASHLFAAVRLTPPDSAGASQRPPPRTMRINAGTPRMMQITAPTTR
jgi:hypothetical protein